MNIPTTILSWALAGASASSTESFTVVDVDMVSSDESAQLTAYGPDGEIAGEVFLWTDAAGRIRLDATFADGLYLSIASDGESSTIDTEDATEVERRMSEIDDVLGHVEVSGWFPCAAGTVLAVAACATGHPVICGVEAYVTACHCLPEYVAKFEGAECPGF